jgi:hypothetical protein
MREEQTTEELMEQLSNINKECSATSSETQSVTNETENKGRVMSVSELRRNPFL